jgi:hypothetical protein
MPAAAGAPKEQRDKRAKDLLCHRSILQLELTARLKEFDCVSERLVTVQVLGLVQAEAVIDAGAAVIPCCVLQSVQGSRIAEGHGRDDRRDRPITSEI